MLYIISLPALPHLCCCISPCLLTWPYLHLTVLSMEALGAQAGVLPISIVDALGSILAWRLVLTDVCI